MSQLLFKSLRLTKLLSKHEMISSISIKKLSSVDSNYNYDVAIVGGGIVGLATARELLARKPDLSCALLEKESQLSMHQTGHNSGVVHAGLYYTPGSLKAKLCVEGLKLLYKYCDENGVPYKMCGKLVVATEPEEVPRLNNIYERALKNGCTMSLIEGSEIKDIEPYCQGLKAIHSPLTGIVDYGLVARTYGKEFESRGGKIYTNFEVNGFNSSAEDSDYAVSIRGTENQVVNAKYVIVCAGLYSDRLAAKAGCDSLPKIVPFRGDYLILKPGKEHLVRGNIYPVPNPKFPFLGFHYTPRMDGSVWLGPNAILAFKREGYNFFDFNLKDFTESLMYPGLQKIVLKNIPAGMSEVYRIINKRAQIKGLQRFIPELKVSDVISGPSGVRAMALDTDGSMVDDFVFDIGDSNVGKRTLHVRNAPSPAATSSLAIAKMISDKAETTFAL